MDKLNVSSVCTDVLINSIIICNESLCVDFSVADPMFDRSIFLFEICLISKKSNDDQTKTSLFEYPVSLAGSIEVSCGRMIFSISMEDIPRPLLDVKIKPSIYVGDISSNVRSEINLLYSIFPISDQQYSKMFIRKIQRWGGVATEFFIADQIVKYFSGSAANRCSAAVVMGYKAVEIGSRTALLAAKKALDDSLVIVKGCKVDWHPRRNIEHLEMSILTSLWHVELALGDNAGLMKSLSAIYLKSFSLTNFFTPAYPITKSLVLLGYIYLTSHEIGKAEESWRRCIEIFKLCVRDSDERRLTLFVEIEESVKSAAMAALGLKSIAKNDSESKKLTAHMVANQCFRVKGDSLGRLLESLNKVTNFS